MALPRTALGSGVLSRRVWPWVALLVLCAWLRLPRLDGPLDLRFDAGVYYVLATSLAEGKGYRILSEPGEIHGIQYPPLLPVIGAAHQLALGTSDPDRVGHGLRWTYSLLFTAYMLAVFWMALAYLPRGGAFLAALLVAFHVRTHFHAEYFVPELPFALVTTLFIGVVGRNEVRAPPRHGGGGGGRHGLLAGILAVAGFYLRTAGLALLATWTAESLLRRDFRQAAMRGVLVLVAVVPWFAYISTVRHGPEYARPTYGYQRAAYQMYNVSYGENFWMAEVLKPEAGRASAGGLLSRVRLNLGKAALSLGESVDIGRNWWQGEIDRVNRLLGVRLIPQRAAEAVLVSLTLLIVGGLILLGARHRWLLVCDVVLSVALFVLASAQDSMLRYLASIASLSAVALLSLLQWIRQRVARGGGGRARWIVRLAIATIPLVLVAQELHTLRNSFRITYHPAEWVDGRARNRSYQLLAYDRPWRLHDEALAWLSVHASPGSIVATSTPHWGYLKTGLKSVQPPWEADPATAQHLLAEVPVDYLVIDNLVAYELGATARRYSIPVVENYPARWDLVYAGADSGSRIYRRVER
jgi:hypothetical protein